MNDRHVRTIVRGDTLMSTLLMAACFGWWWPTCGSGAGGDGDGSGLDGGDDAYSVIKRMRFGSRRASWEYFRLGFWSSLVVTPGLMHQ